MLTGFQQTPTIRGSVVSTTSCAIHVGMVSGLHSVLCLLAVWARRSHNGLASLWIKQEKGPRDCRRLATLGRAIARLCGPLLLHLGDHFDRPSFPFQTSPAVENSGHEANLYPTDTDNLIAAKDDGQRSLTALRASSAADPVVSAPLAICLDRHAHESHPLSTV